MPAEKIIYCGTVREWRAWLEKHHLSEKKIALVNYKKHTGKPSMTHRESMNEAICFGWIDTTIKRLDEDTFLRRFARRTDKSKWSKNTLSYAHQLLADGKMAPEGIKRYHEGRAKPTHDHGLSLHPTLPADLKEALQKEHALALFEAFAPSYKRTYFRWIERAKRSETRQKRIAAVVARALSGRKQWNT